MIIQGCQRSDVGGYSLGLFPKLDIICKKILSLFDSNGNFCINEAIIRKKLGNGFGDFFIAKNHIQSSNSTLAPIKNLVLYGFSRGAVTCFALAKHLQEKYSKKKYSQEIGSLETYQPIPIYIFANQPVSGNMIDTQNTIVRKFSDLTMCTNIKLCHTILGQYDMNSIPYVHQLFFKLMLPTLHADTVHEIFSYPIYNHLKGRKLMIKAMRNFLFNVLPQYGVCIIPTNIMNHYRASENEKFLEVYEECKKACPPKIHKQPLFDNFKIENMKFAIFNQLPKGTRKTQNLAGYCHTNMLGKSCNNYIIKGFRAHCKRCGLGYFCNTCMPRREDIKNLHICNICYDLINRYLQNQLQPVSLEPDKQKTKMSITYDT